ncbi:MAG: helix-turn-helix transcriptional regulator [Treponema sp.]|nr:helix-turn-helix transcriptional regulator [Treponema sp.]MBP3630238.1 helix-turn-helix transcriptional regulator [Clostridia bacterium]
MSIGENIRSLRESKGFSQRKLATEVGVTQSMIAQIERGTKAVNIQLGKQIAEVFGCTIDDLISDRG